jgi:hypothetical protein
MKMQDNELDNLFRSNLEGFEMEPSAKVWQNIDAELQTGKRRAIVLMPFLSVAASIIVLATAGILFISHKTRVAHNLPAKNGIAKNTPPAKKSTVASVIIKPQVAQAIIATNPVNPAARIQPIKKNTAVQQQPVTSTTTNQPLPVAPPVQQVIAEVPQKHDEDVKIDTAVIAQTTPPVQNIKPATIASNIPAAGPATKPAGKKHRIHSFGDMMNVVIAAVDKRKDKFIEFSDTDDDESTITGVNLGIVAVKKQN